MIIELKLYASFRTGRFGRASREYTEGANISDVVRDLGLKESDLGTIFVNGRFEKLQCRLKDGDILALFPLLGGG